ncbi:MAG: methyltransferase domain-containing protein [Bacteroidota bacterium]
MLTEQYWSQRYQTGSTPWDLSHPSTPLAAYINQLTDPNLEVLVPGAGSAHEAAYLWEQGYQNTFVLDWAKEPLRYFQERYPEFPQEHLLQQDFFQHTGTYDLILEQTFFCALMPSMRPAYVKHMHQLLKPNAKLAGLFFQFPLTEQGPPFGGSKEEYEQLFRPHFHTHILENAYNSEPGREGKELFFIFNRK